jgi:flagellar biosynthetic protein FliP
MTAFALIGCKSKRNAMRMDALAKPTRWIVLCIALAFLASARPANAQEVPGETPEGISSGLRHQPAQLPAASSAAASTVSPITGAAQQISDLTKRENLPAALQVVILLTVLSLAPSLLLMMTSFTRIIIVLSLLRQAMGTQQLPPNQVLIGLALFMTFLIMAPTWDRVNNEALKPYMDGTLDQSTALDRAQKPVRDFMIKQIKDHGNDEDVFLFSDAAGKPQPKHWEDVSTLTIVPAFMLGELKTAFLMGFKVYLPFLIVDMVISSVLISMGMMMLPPAMISLPFKLLLFVLVDGWRLITGSLMGSFMK